MLWYMNKKVVVFTGGGTGGHVFPGVAVAEKLVSDTLDIHWIGSGNGMEKKIVERFHIPFHSIPAGKLRRYFSLLNFIDVFKIAAGFFISLFLLKHLKTAILFSKGGFVSVPPAAAAKVLGIPVITHDSDLDPGLSTRINAHFAEKILVPYQESTRNFRQREKVIVTGNPVRSEILHGNAGKGRMLFAIPEGKKVLLVLGGSQGALQLNTLVNAIAGKLIPEIYIVHQMGSFNFTASGKKGYSTVPFLTEELPHILAAADLVLSRAGAGTLWENGVTGKASLLIPLGTGSSRGDQIRNAEYFSSKHAAVVLYGEITPENVYTQIYSLMKNDERRAEIGNAARHLCNRNAAEKIVSIIQNAL